MRSIPAIFENGVFRPTKSITLPQGAEVEVIIPDERDPVALMQEQFPLSFGALTDEDALEMKRVIEDECERIDQNAS